jgi:hypothetical protein
MPTKGEESRAVQGLIQLEMKQILRLTEEMALVLAEEDVGRLEPLLAERLEHIEKVDELKDRLQSLGEEEVSSAGEEEAVAILRQIVELDNAIQARVQEELNSLRASLSKVNDQRRSAVAYQQGALLGEGVLSKK